MTAPQVEITPDWQSYLDMTQDVKPFMGWPSGTSPQDSLLQDTIDAACWWAQDFLGRPIAPTQFFRRFNGYSGWGGSMIDLPYYPVIVDASHPIVVTETRGTSGQFPLTLQSPEAQGGSDMYSLDAIRGIITRSFQGLIPRPTWPGLKNIEVTWWAGFNPVPPVWKRATLRLVKHWWTHDQQRVLAGFPRTDGGHPEPEFVPFVPNDIMQAFVTARQVGIA